MKQAHKKIKVKVKVLREMCIGAATCEVISPKVFGLDEMSKAFVQDQGTGPDKDGFIEVTQDTLENVLEAAKSCPTFAVIILDEENNQIYPAP